MLLPLLLDWYSWAKATSKFSTFLVGTLGPLTKILSAPSTTAPAAMNSI